MNRRLWLVACAPLALVAAGCPAEDLTYGEAQEAVQEVALASEAGQLAEGSVEISTHFTLGKAAEEAAAEVRDFIQTQLPCAEVTLADKTLTVVYGALPGECLYNGRQITGTHVMTFAKTDGEVQVSHEWKDMTNGRVEVDGTADVTWDLEAKSRHIVHQLTWTRTSDGATATGSGDRTQSPLGGSWQDGVSVDGTRSWEGPRGTWDLEIDQVEWRWIDPVPQSGSYVLTTPKDKTLTMSFSRIDEDTIEVTVEGTRRDHKFRVNSLGDVQGDGEEG